MADYDQFGLQTKTALVSQSPADGTILLASNGDLFWIVYNDPTPPLPAKVAVHVLTAASNYQQMGLETKTALVSQSPADGTFLLASNGDLFWIVYNDPGPPATIAVHVLTAASNYQQMGLETKTALVSQSPADGTFLLASNGDLFWIVYNDPGPPATIAVHVLTAASNYQQMGLETKTILGSQSPADGIFRLANNGDLFWIVYDDPTPPPPASVAVHVLLSAQSEDEASLQAYNNCLAAQGNGLGNAFDMAKAFYSGDIETYLQTIYKANQQAVNDQGCVGLLTPAMKKVVLGAQQNWQQEWQRLHPGEGV